MRNQYLFAMAPEKRQTLDNFWEMCANIVRNACIDEILGDKERIANE